MNQSSMNRLWQMPAVSRGTSESPSAILSLPDQRRPDDPMRDEAPIEEAVAKGRVATRTEPRIPALTPNLSAAGIRQQEVGIAYDNEPERTSTPSAITMRPDVAGSVDDRVVQHGFSPAYGSNAFGIRGVDRNEIDGREANMPHEMTSFGSVGTSLVGNTAPSRISGVPGANFRGARGNLVSSENGQSVPGAPRESQSGHDFAPISNSSAIAGELWLDTLSLRDWLQNYLTGEIGRASLATNRSGNSLTYP